MKKITLLLSFIACVVLANAQTNLLTNPGFETWAAGVPTGWTLTTSNGTATQSTVVASGTSALQIAATARYDVTQTIVAPNGTFDATKKYRMSLKYKITAGDGTDLRVWCALITSASGVTPITYYNGVPPSSADSAMYYWPLHGPNGKSATTGYWGYNAANQDWQSYTYDFTPPTGITQFSFQVRNYTGSTAILDDFYFGLADGTGVNSVSADVLSVSLAGKLLTVNNAENGFEVYNTTGAKVKVSQSGNNTMNLSDLSNGIYVVRSGKSVAKIKL